MSELHKFCRSGNLPKVIQLLSKYNINSKNEIGQTPLHVACSQQRNNVVSCLLTMEGCDPNAQDINGNTPLHLASLHGNIEGAKEITSIHPDSITIVNNSGKTALHFACECCSSDLIEIFCALPHCDQNCRDNLGRTPLHLVCMSQSKTSWGDHVLYTLSTHTACDSTIEDQYGCIPVHYIQDSAKLSLFLKYYKCSLNYDHQDSNGDTTLHKACRIGNVEFVEYLVGKCNVNCQNNKKQTPLHLACENEAPVALCGALFTDENCKVNIQDENGDCPLHIAIRTNNERVVRLFICVLEADVNTINHQNSSPMHLASKLCSPKILSMLLNTKIVDVNIVNSLDSDSMTPLRYLVKHNEHALCSLLIEYLPGLETVNIDDDGNTMLHVAIKNRRTDLTEYLVRTNRKDYINVQNSSRHTALHLACLKPSTRAKAQILLDSGKCDLHLLDTHGKSALSYACESKSPSLCQLFVENSLEYSISWRDSNENSLLHHCLFDKCHELLKQEKYNKLNDCLLSLNVDGQTPLHVACIQGCSSEAFEYCLKSVGKDVVNLADTHGKTPLQHAEDNKHLRLCKQIIHFSCKESVNLENDQSLLHLACQVSSVEDIVHLLHALKDEINKTGKEGKTPLHFACLGTSPWSLSRTRALLFKVEGFSKNLTSLELTEEECVQDKNDTLYLTQLSVSYRPNIDLTIIDSHGFTALDYADSQHSASLCKLILSYCVDHIHNDLIMKASVANGNTLLHLACKYSYDSAIQPLTVVCDVNARNHLGETALHLACKHGTCDTVKALVLNSYLESPYILDVADNKGMSPLCVANYLNKLDICKLLLELAEFKDVDQQDPYTRNSLIHKAFSSSDIELSKLVLRRSCNINRTDSRGRTPLFLSCEAKEYTAVKILLDDDLCDPRIRDVSGKTVLHVASDLSTLKTVLSSRSCDVNITDYSGQTALACAFSKGKFDICKEFLSSRHTFAQLNWINPASGKALLHVACEDKDLALVKLVVSQDNCIADIRYKDKTPLHIAIDVGSWDIVEYLLTCGKRCGQNYVDMNGLTPINYSHLDRKFEFCKFQLKHSTEPFFLLNWTDWKIYNSLLHEACSIGDQKLVQLIVDQKNCRIYLQNRHGNSPLHLACEKGIVHIIQSLLAHPMIGHVINLANNKGETPLHLAARNGLLDIVKVLLLCRNCNPLAVNLSGKTALQVAKSYDVIQTLNSYCQCTFSHPLKPVVKIFVAGNPFTGKSSLIKSFTKNASFLRKIVPDRFNVVSDVQGLTAGIIPVEFESKQLGKIVLYDLAGQSEYYSSHSAVIESTVASATPIFVLVNDISEEDQTVALNLKFWLSFIDNHSTKASSPPHVIIAGSHADMLKSKGHTVSEKESIVNAIVQADKHNIAFQGFVAINCCKLASSGLDRFRSLLRLSCDVCRDSSTISTSCHVLAAFLQKTFQSNGLVACKLGDIVSVVSQGDVLLPQSAQEILELLVTMNEREEIILFKEEANIEDSHIILDKQILLSEINGTLFAPENFRQHSDFASSTGVVPSSKIRKGFPRYHPKMITKYLTYLEFCQKVDDTETNKLVQLGDPALASESSSDIPNKDDYYFFPALVRASPPTWLWKDVREVVYKWGWCLQCTDSGQFITSRFLHVLLLRLAFTFPLKASTRLKPFLEEDSPVLTRQCSVWKNGLHWVSQGGVEVVIEVGEQYQRVTVMIQYKENRDVNFAEVRAAVLKEVLTAKNQFCSNVKMVEYVIHPDNVKYPTSNDPILFEMRRVAESMLDIHKKPDVPDVSGKYIVSTERLVGFEPYSGIDSELATRLFQSSERDNIERIIPLVAIKLARKSDMFRKIIVPDSIADEPVSHEVCQDLFEDWCSQQDVRVTTEMFRVEILDKFSLLCGRNPLVSLIYSLWELKLGDFPRYYQCIYASIQAMLFVPFILSCMYTLLTQEVTRSEEVVIPKYSMKGILVCYFL